MASDARIQNCLGIRVRYDERLREMVDSRGLWRWKEIVIGPGFLAFPPREQQAILLHEIGHAKMNHVAKLLWFIARSPRRIAVFLATAFACRDAKEGAFHREIARRLPEVAQYRIAQEIEADRFAAIYGYGPELARVFASLQTHDSPFHPHPAERIARLYSAN